MATELHDLSIAELAGLIAARKLSPLELTEALIQRVERYDAQTRAFITPTFDLARRQARAAETEIARGKTRGPLHGIPFALKDIYDTKGILTSGHSRVFVDRIPDEDATTTSRLYDAGAVLLGKLATHEMAHAGPSFDLPWPPARNPWNLTRFTGGSSSGSGAAVAAGMVPVALGSDTGGSIRGPASLCGIVGLMPTFGLVSRAGVITNSYTFDHCGPLARTVEDCALTLEALAGYDPKDAGSLSRPIPQYRRALGEDLRGLRIGVLRHHWEDDIPASDDVRRAMDAALDVLRRLGAELEECRVRPLASYFDVKIIVAESEIFSVHQKNLIARPKDFGADFRSRALPSVLFTASDYVQATREHRRLMIEMEPLYARFDAFVTAGMGEAPRLSDYRSVSFWQRASLLTAWNVTSQPVLALPNGFGGNGLPLGMQIVGRPFGEETILKVGHAYERATEWHTRRPSLIPGAAAPEVTPPPVLSEPADGVDAETRDLCVKAARRAGLQLDDLMLAQLLEGAPYALGMVRRLRRDHDLSHEPANVFSFPPARPPES
ncbi:MAG: Asp-tRNA(Asn)/Glu-tRNA(Gln) amidotransferase GatCAB subunit A [Candidatus Rokuibacteriota bacterium]|nr:MAG: Asp-tRNA(Asn)/Glu-tRNA(Gln) amidotransferase GatCAB subunit A [Candidatus Rokubacteria bacterium]